MNESHGKYLIEAQLVINHEIENINLIKRRHTTLGTINKGKLHRYRVKLFQIPEESHLI